MSEEKKQNDSGNSTNFEQAKAALESAVPGPETTWDKEAPTGPPGEKRQKYATWFQPLLAHFNQIVADETVFAELCLERAVRMVNEVHNKGLAGIDYFADVSGGGGGGSTRANIVAAAIPWAVEFYKQCTVSLNQRPDEYQAALEEAKALKSLAERDKIVTVGT